MQKSRILVIDDNPVMVTLVELMLEHEGFEIVSAGSGAEGLAAIEMRRPDLVLMDIVLPDTDGAVLTRGLRQNPAYQDLKILAFTSSISMGDDAGGWKALGFDGHLLKPFNVKAAIAQIRDLLI